MFQTYENYQEIINQPQRQMKTKVYFNGSKDYLESEIIEASIEEIGMSSDVLTIGDICTNKAEIKFYMQEPIPLEGGYFSVEHCLYGDEQWQSIPMGIFYIQDIQKLENTSIVKIIGYDCTTYLKKSYVPTIEYPATIEEVIDDICQQCNVTYEEYEYPELMIDYYMDITCEEMLCYMAGLMGKNIKANRYGNIEFYWWNLCDYSITKDLQYMYELKRTTDENIIIHSLTSGTEDHVIACGEGYGISFHNPYMTQEILNHIFSNIKDFTYTPLSLQYRGNPALEIGDVVLVEDQHGQFYHSLVSEHTLLLTGLQGKIESRGNINDDIVMREGPTEKKIKKMYSSLQTSFKETTETLIGAKGGYFIIDRDEQGYPTGFKIMDTPTLTEHTHLWLFNKNGFGFSENGGQTFQNIAIDMLGNINANAIHTGVIQGNCFDIDLENGTIVMGQRSEDQSFESEWFRVDENGIFMSLSQQTLEEIKNVNDSIGELQEEQKMLHQYFRYGDEGIEIGSSLSDIMMKLSNEKLSFYQNSQEIAYISQNKLYITEGLFVKKCTIGSENNFYEWIIRENGNMSLKYREGFIDGN